MYLYRSYLKDRVGIMTYRVSKELRVFWLKAFHIMVVLSMLLPGMTIFVDLVYAKEIEGVQATINYQKTVQRIEITNNDTQENPAAPEINLSASEIDLDLIVPGLQTGNSPQSGQNLLFIENIGQFDSRFRFSVSGEGGAILLAPDAIWITLYEKQNRDNLVSDDYLGKPISGVNLRLSFVGSNENPHIVGIDPLGTQVSYLLGGDPNQWQTNVPVWTGVRYIGIYPGVDLEITGKAGNWEWQFIADTDTALKEVSLTVEGMDRLSLRNDRIEIGTNVAELSFPLIGLNGTTGETIKTATVEANSILSPIETTETIEQTTSQSTTTVSDTAPLYLRLFGLSANSPPSAGIAADDNGYAYITGTVNNYFPTTPGAFQTAIAGNSDSYIAKLSPDGYELIYATYIGDTGYDHAYDISVDADIGDVYIVGSTTSPSYLGVTCGFGGYDISVAKLNSTGGSLEYSFCLGEEGHDTGFAIAIDQQGAAYITGRASSSSGDSEVFISRIKPDGSGTDYYLQINTQNEYGLNSGYDITVSPGGYVYVTGQTYSTDFPVTNGSQCQNNCYHGDAFVIRLDSLGNIDFATYLGGTDGEEASGIAVDNTGAMYISGATVSNDFPTHNAYDNSFNTGLCGEPPYEWTCADSFVTKMDSNGDIIYSTFLGGEGDDDAYNLVIDTMGQAYIIGRTTSSDFPITFDSFQPTCADCDSVNLIYDFFIARFDPDGQLGYSTFLGGNGYEWNGKIAIDASNLIYATGTTTSPDFPHTIGSYLGGQDLFVAKFNLVGSPILPGESVLTPGEGGCFGSKYSSTNPTVGGPINPRTGGYDYHTIDLSLPTSSGQLSFERWYTTMATETYTSTLGHGWTHNLDTRLIFPDGPGGKEGIVGFKAHSANVYQFIIDDVYTSTSTYTGTFTAYPGLCAVLTSVVENNEVTEFIVEDQALQRYTFATDGKLISKADAQGHTIFYTYQGPNGELSQVSDETGNRSLVLIYNTEGFVESVVEDIPGLDDPQIDFFYTGGNLTSVDDVLDFTWTYTYTDTRHPYHLTSIFDPRDKVVEHTKYDEQGRVVEQYNGEGDLLAELSYLSDGITIISNTLDTTRVITTTYIYDSRNTMTDLVTSAGETIKTYDNHFGISSLTDPAGNTTTMTWSEDGANLESILDAEDNLTTLDYDALNNLTGVTDSRGYTTTYIYSGTLLTASTDALEHTTLYTYTTAADAPQPPGLLKGTRSPLGLETAYTYDPYGQRLTATDAAKNTTSYTYDDLGRMETVTEPQGRTNWNCYDPAGRVTRTVANASGDGGTPATDPCDVVNYQPSNDPDYDRINTNLYDAVGNLIATTDDRGRTHRTYYDDANRVVAMVQNLSNWDVYTDTLPITSTRTITENLTTEMVYDLNSNLIATIDVGGKVTRTYYDTLNRPQYMVQNLTNWGIGETSPPPEYLRTVEENLTTETVYDLNGNIIATIGPDGVIDRTYYDELNRPILAVQNVASSWISTDEMPTCNRDDGADSYICTETIYDPNGNLIATIDPAARITRTYYDELNRPQYMVQNLSNWDVYTDTLPVENLQTNSENLVTETVYNDDGQVIASIDPLGKITRTYYDDAGRPEVVVRNLTDHAIASDTPPDFDPDYPDQNVRTETVYDEYGRTIATIDPLDRITRTYYDALDRPQYVVRNLTDHVIASDTPPDFDPDYPDQNARTETVYDEYGRTIATIDPLDRVTRTYYDVLDRPVVVVRNWDGASIQDETPPQHNPAYPDRNIRSETIYDKDGMAIATVDTLGRITRTYFDGLGRPVTVVRNLVGQAVFTETPPSYDPDYPDQNVRTETGYDLAGRRVRISDNSDAATTFAYDDLGRQIGITDAISNTTTTVYDVLGQRVSTTDAKGIETSFEYDALGRMAAVVENHQTGVNPNHEVNVRTEYTYDALGNRLTIRDANAVLNNTNDVTVFEYDGLGRLVSETDPLSHTTSYTYDAAGQRVSLTDAESATTIYGYDGLGRLTSTNYPNPDADVTFEYNAAGQRIEMSDGLGLTTWDYDLVGRPITITSAITGTVGYGYDSVGNRIELVYPDSQTVNYAYDDLDRMTQVTDWDSGTTGYTYDRAGRLGATTYPNGVTTTFDYDLVGQLRTLTHEDSPGNLLAFYDYKYDPVGNREVVTETLLGPYPEIFLPVVMKEYEGEGGEAISGGEESSKKPADPYPGPQEKVPAPPDDGGKDPTDPYPPPETEKEGSTFWQKVIEFFTRLMAWVTPKAKAYSQPVRVAPSILPAVLESGEPGDGSRITTTIRYDYDPLNRLTDANYGDNWGYTYSYDAVGNRTSLVSPQGTTSYDYDEANRLSSVNGTTYTWDGNGNLLNDGVNTYTYDHANRLISISGATSASYGYNGLGDRVQQTVDGNTTYYSLDLAAGLTQVLDDGDNTYLYGLVRIGEEQPGGWVFHHGDALGSVRQLTDGNGVVTLVRSYQPYGEVLSSSGSGETSYSYTGEWADGYIKFIYLRSRYYAPETGHFITRDIWQGDYTRPLSLNRWNYVEANPINRVDPSGSCSVAGWTASQGLFTEENCDRLEAGDLEFTEQWYYQFADHVENNLPQTATNMRHYLNGTGTELQLHSRFMMEDIYGWPKVQNEVSRLVKWYVRRQIDDLNICALTNVGPDIFANGFTPPYIQAWKFWPFATPQLDIAGSLGSFRLDVEIDGTLHRTSNRRAANPDLRLHLVVLDRYNWHKGLNVVYEGNEILDAWAGSLEDAGLARSYLVRGDLNIKYEEPISGLWFGINVGNDPPGSWVEASCLGSQFDIDQEGPGQIDYCGNPMR